MLIYSSNIFENQSSTTISLPQVYESSTFHAEIGAGIGLGPNVVKIIKTLLPDLKWENLKSVDWDCVRLKPAYMVLLGAHLSAHLRLTF